MPRKLVVCAAKHCQGNSLEPDISMFSFPSLKHQPERHALWRSLMMVDESNKVTSLFLCSRHFLAHQFRPQGLIYGANPHPSCHPFPPSHIENPLPVADYSTPCPSSPLPGPSSVSHDSQPYSFPSSFPSSLPSSSINTTPAARSTPKCKRGLLSAINATRVSHLTPRKKKLVLLCNKQKKNNSRLAKRLKAEKKHRRTLLRIKRDSDAFASQFEDVMTPSALTIFMSQINNRLESHPNTRRWTVQEKILSASIMKKSSRTYNYLRKLLILPTKRTLVSFLNKIPFPPGINPHIFNSLSKTLADMEDELAGYAVLMFDEMAIKEFLEYDRSRDVITGFEDIGRGTTNSNASKALVFMAQGLFRKWKQPLAYYFTKSKMDGQTLHTLIEEVLEAAHESNINIKAIVSDMSPVNLAATKLLKEDNTYTNSVYFKRHDKAIYTFNDPPHLIKCWRNMFIKHDIKVPVNITLGGKTHTTLNASWKHIVEGYELDKKSITGIRSMWKLTEEHIKPNLNYTMKVKHAAQIFSQTVAACLSKFVECNKLPVSAIGTIELCMLLNGVFDSINGGGPIPGGYENMKMAINKANESQRIKFWRDSIKKMELCEFNMSSPPPCQQGWIDTLKAFLLLWEDLKKSNDKIKHLDPRRVNQDPLENLFGMVRAHCGSNQNPTASQFTSALKTCIVNNLSFIDQPSSTNCERESDPSPALSSLREFLQEPSPSALQEGEEVGQVDFFISKDFKNLIDSLPDSYSEYDNVGLSYVSGFVAKRCSKRNNCNNCDRALKREPDANDVIFLRERLSHRSLLVYPTLELINLVGNTCTLFEKLIGDVKSEKDIGKKLLSILGTQLDLTWLGKYCGTHADDLGKEIIKHVIQIMIPWWCRRQNQEIKISKKFDSTKVRRKVSILKGL